MVASRESNAIPGVSGTWERFEDDDSGYLNWLNEHPRGYVLNAARPPKEDYLKLHRPWCSFLRRAIKENKRLTGTFLKICSDTLAGVKDWAWLECETGPDDGCYCMR